MNQKVLILGLGESGLAAAQWLLRSGARLRVADTRKKPERLDQLLNIAPECEFVVADSVFSPALLDGCDLVIVSPGLSERAELAEIIPAAKAHAIPVWSEIELFAQALAELRTRLNYQAKILAITGTNGKTTVTSLTGLLVERAGKSVRIAGNISPSVLDVLRDCIEQQTLPEVWVLELSSFQLHSTFSLQADAATVLNITQDHLDWHGSMSAYAIDKARIFSPNTIQVLNRDDPLVMQMHTGQSNTITFGQSVPVGIHEFGLLNENGVNWLCMASATGEEPKRLKNQPKPTVEISINRLMPADALKIRGRHNAVNALAALALCRAIGLPLAPLLHGLREYHGEPHRVELIATLHGIEYYDDSKGTNVGATVAALNGLADEHSRIVLIAGGVGKGQDFHPLRQPIERTVSCVCLIGVAAVEIAEALEGSQVTLLHCRDMEHAVQQAAAHARSGDKVLLSPACASFDMFKNYADRAAMFSAAVQDIAFAQGGIL